MNDNNKIKFAGRLKSYMIWPILLSLLLIAMNVVMYFIQVTAGIWFTVCVGIYVVIVLSMYFRSRPKIMNEMITFAAEYGQVQKRLLQDLEIPYVVMDMQGKLLWVNNAFTELTGKTKQYHKSVTSVFSGITQEKLPKNEEDEKEFHITYEKRDFRVLVKAVCIDELLDRSRMLELQVEGCYIQVLYLFDETELNEYIRKCEDETMVAGLLYLDNYEEVMESIEPVRRSLLAALVERKMNQYFTRFDGMLRRLEKDKYLLVMRRKSLEELKEKRFDILEEVKTVNIGNEMAVTISIGIGYNAGSYIGKFRICTYRHRPCPWTRRRPGGHEGWGAHPVFWWQDPGGGEKHQSEGKGQSPCIERIYAQQGTCRGYGTQKYRHGFLWLCDRYLPRGENPEQEDTYCAGESQQFCAAVDGRVPEQRRLRR